jgi:hypothetical protein
MWSRDDTHPMAGRLKPNLRKCRGSL